MPPDVRTDVCFARREKVSKAIEAKQKEEAAIGDEVRSNHVCVCVCVFLGTRTYPLTALFNRMFFCGTSRKGSHCIVS